MMRKKKRVFSFILGVTLVFSSGIPPQAAEAATTVTVDPSQEFQTLDGWGTSLAWWGHAIGGWSSSKKADIVENVFDPVNGIGLNAARYNIGGGLNPDRDNSQFRVAADIPSYQPEEGVWDWNADANQRWVLSQAKAEGANLFEAFSNSPPYWMTYWKCASGAKDGGNNLQDPVQVTDGVLEVAVKRTGSNGGAYNDPLINWIQVKTTDGQRLYTVDAGDSTPGSLESGEQFGARNSQEDQAYGTDSSTGYTWGYETYGSTSTADNGSTKWDSVRLDEGDTAGEGITYKFDVDNGEYRVEVGFQDPWSNPDRQVDVIIDGTMTLWEYVAPSTADTRVFEGFYDDFADYLAQVIDHVQSQETIQFHSVSPLNEPVSTWWTCGNDQEGSHFDRSNQNKLIKNVHDALAAQGLSNVHISGPEEYSIDDTIDTYNAYDSTAQSYMSQINTHGYAGGQRAELRNLAALNGKDLWMSEVTKGGSAGHDHDHISGALQLSNQIVADMKEMRPQVWTYWQAVENEQPAVEGDHSHGLIHANFEGSEDYWLQKQYYAMGQYSKYIRPGYTFVDVNHADTIAAYDKSSGDLTMVTTNDTSSDRTLTFDLSQFDTVGSQAASYRTSSTENLQSLSNLSITNQTFTATAQANAITTFTISGVSYDGSLSVNDHTQGIGTHQFEYNGGWGYYNSQSGAYENDNHWSGNTGDTYEITFDGTQIELYGATAPGHGIAAVSIDGGNETDVDFYASSRSDNTRLWTSPTLSQGTHTLKVRVTGRQNSSATGATITADRVVIHP